MDRFASENGSHVSNSTNATNTNHDSTFVVPKDLQIGVTLFALVIFLVALIGNTIIVYIVCSCNHMRNTTNILIANMAIADLWMTLDIPYVVKWLYVHDSWFGGVFGQILCKFCNSAQAGSIACSIFTLICISLDRSLAILLPMKTILTTKIIKIMIAVIWLLTIAISSPLFIATDIYQKPNGQFGCFESGWGDINPKARPKYSMVFSLSTYAIPLALIAVMYAMTGLRLWNRKVPGHRTLRAHKRIQSSTKRATIMLVTVVVVFAICWFPFQIRELIESFNSSSNIKLPIALFILLPWFGFANSAINPILYFVFSENYRREFKRTFTRMSRRRSSTSQMSRGTTLRTRMSLSMSVPLRKLRNDSCTPEGGSSREPKELASKRPRDSKCESPTRFLVALETPESESVFGSLEANTNENELEIKMDNEQS